MTRLKSYFEIKSEKHAEASHNDQESLPSEEEAKDDSCDSSGTAGLKPNEQDKPMTTNQEPDDNSCVLDTHHRHPVLDTGACPGR